MTMAVTKQGGERWVANTITLESPSRRDLPKAPLQEIGRAEHGASRFTWLAPENSRDLPDRAVALGSLDENDEVVSKFLWEPWDWARSVMHERFPDVELTTRVDVALAAPGINLKHRFRAALKPAEVHFMVGVALSQEAPDLVRFDMVLQGVNNATHELLHFVADKDGYFGLDYPNLTSEEAAAYTFAACSTMAIGRYREQTNLLADWALTPEWARQRLLRPSKAILKDSRKHNGFWTTLFYPSARGAVLASVGIQEALGGRESIGSEDLPMLDRYCRAAIDPAIDWKRERPCQTRKYRDLCQAPINHKE